MQEKTSSGYDVLYPQTIAAQIEDVYSKDETITTATKALYGLGETATPNQVFSAISTALDGKARIQTGSYVGTGTYGASNPCSLTFEFKPNFFLVRHGSFLNLSLCGNAILTNSITFQVDNDNLTWYSTVSQSEQNNTLGTRYYYVASVASESEVRIGTFYFSWLEVVSYNFVIGMTWEEFVNDSHYNVNNRFYILGNNIGLTDSNNLIVGYREDGNIKDVYKTDFVQEQTTYIVYK